MLPHTVKKTCPGKISEHDRARCRYVASRELQLGDRDNDLSGPAIGIVAVVFSVVGPVTSRTVPAIDGPAIVVGVIQVAP